MKISSIVNPYLVGFYTKFDQCYYGLRGNFRVIAATVIRMNICVIQINSGTIYDDYFVFYEHFD